MFSRFFSKAAPVDPRIEKVKQAWRTHPEGRGLVATLAAGCRAADKVLGLQMHDQQIAAALALADGKIAEMQTGEGKTLAAVPAVAWLARERNGVHVMTVNDYLARRDAAWMGPVYAELGLTVGFINSGMTSGERREAYACDVTYTTANECGFDLLRDQLCLSATDQVHRPFQAVVIDEADSILIDEARIPLVIAGGLSSSEPDLALQADRLVKRWQRGAHFQDDEFGRNISLTDGGIRLVERAFGIENLFASENLPVLSAVQDAVHAHALLRRDVDYIVKHDAIESVDEFKGRIAQDRRWPAGLHNAIEAKEGVRLKTQGSVLGSITLQNLVGLFPHVAGMTGTAASQRRELFELYELEVEVIPSSQARNSYGCGGPRVSSETSERVGVARRDPHRARQRAPAAGGHRQRRGVGTLERAARGCFSHRTERAQ